MKIAIIIPTFQRNQNHLDLIKTWEEFGVESHLVFALEQKDEINYTKIDNPKIKYVVGNNNWMAEAVNFAFDQIKNDYDIIGFMGDDHRFKTSFEPELIEAIKTAKVVYGNDLLQKENLPTQVWIDAEVLRRIGYFCPPDFRHLYLDNTWLEWGKALGIKYLENVIVEHLHPASGKVATDKNYERVNSKEMYDHDFLAFEDYKINKLEEDLKKCYGI